MADPFVTYPNTAEPQRKRATILDAYLVRIPTHERFAEFGHAIRVIRAWFGLGLGDAARAAGITVVQLSELERGRSRLASEAEYGRMARVLCGAKEEVRRG